MKRAILNELNQLNEKLQGHVYMMNFSYMNLCVKAEAVALLPVKVTIDDEQMNLEKTAMVGQNDEYSFMVIPNMEDDLLAVGQGIAMVHPEFKQERKTMDVELDDGSHRDVPYILITMPEVDNNRRDALKQAVDALYDTCKVQMEATNAKADANIAALTADMQPDEVDNLKKVIDERRDIWRQHRDKLHEDKLQEIEDGYQRWQTQKEERKQLQSTDDNSVATSMRIDQEYQ